MGCCSSRSAVAADAAAGAGGQQGSSAGANGRAGGRSTLGTGQAGNGGAGSDDLAYGPVESTSAVKVAVVVRPLLAMEKAKNAKDIVELEPPCVVKLPPVQIAGSNAVGEPFKFTYDRAYLLNSLEESRRLFRELVQPLLDRFMQGFHATVFAYGQTGSGKTYTMGTAAGMKEVSGSGEPVGVIPRAIKAIFAAVEKATAEYDVMLKVDMIEIYNDEVRDLLVNPGANSAAPPIVIREAPDKTVWLEGIRSLDVKTEADVAQLLEQGNAQRAVASHNLNETSSRSHAIFTVSMEQRRKPSAPAVGQKMQLLRSKLHLVDLAGSERQKDTGAEGAKLQEGIQINKGLFALGNVISALTEAKGRRSFIPYRDSKLTRILQDSLGGTSETLMVANISPAHYNQEQTLSTLRYAARARSIQNQLRLHNAMTAEEEVIYLKRVLAERDDEVAALREQLAAAGTAQAAAQPKPPSAKGSPAPSARQVAVRAGK